MTFYFDRQDEWPDSDASQMVPTCERSIGNTKKLYVTVVAANDCETISSMLHTLVCNAQPFADVKVAASDALLSAACSGLRTAQTAGY